MNKLNSGPIFSVKILVLESIFEGDQTFKNMVKVDQENFGPSIPINFSTEWNHFCKNKFYDTLFVTWFLLRSPQIVKLSYNYTIYSQRGCVWSFVQYDHLQKRIIIIISHYKNTSYLQQRHGSSWDSLHSKAAIQPWRSILFISSSTLISKLPRYARGGDKNEAAAAAGGGGG